MDNSDVHSDTYHSFQTNLTYEYDHILFKNNCMLMLLNIITTSLNTYNIFKCYLFTDVEKLIFLYKYFTFYILLHNKKHITFIF